MQRSPFSLTKRRALALALLILFAFGGYTLRLFQIQIVEGDEYADIANNSSSTNVTIQASRGEILDRYLTPMAVNSTSFSIVFDHAFFPTDKSDAEQKSRNDIILSLTNLLTATGGAWNDTLPVSRTAPYSFMEERTSSISYLKHSLLRMADYATADQCMAELIKRYSLSAYTQEQQRVIAGVRYEIEIRLFTLKNPFTFSTDVSEEAYNVILENSARYPGVNVQTVAVREYVSGRVGAHLLGTVGPIYAEEYQTLKDKGYSLSDTVGKSGIEAALESELRGTNGVSTVVKDTDGNVVEKKVSTQPVPGNSVILTLDYRLQQATQGFLNESIATLRKQKTTKKGEDVRSGSVVMLDVKTGGVLVSASWPDYDLSTYNTDYAELVTNKDKPLFNRALNGAFAVGSTMKPGVALAGLNEGLIDANSTPVFCNGAYHFYASSGFEPGCLGYHRNVNVVTALAKSCNVFFYDLGRRLGIQKMNEYSILYGLGQKTGVEIGETAGVLAGPTYSKSIGKTWYPGDTCTAAIGQSDNLFTPIQMAAYTMTIANNGVRYKTHLVKSVRSYDGTETAVEPQVAATVKLSQYAIDTVKKGMVEVTKTGTAGWAFRSAPYTLAAKTGTAEPGITTRSDHGVFIAYAPADNPEVAIAVVLENGTSRPSTALAKKVLDAYFSNKTHGVSPDPEGELLP